MERDDISAIIQRVPQLTAFGIGLYEGGRGLSADEKEKKLQEGQEALRNAGENCTRICDWLGPITKNKTINMQHSS